MNRPAVWIWAAVAVGSPCTILLIEPDSHMWAPLGAMSLIALFHTVRGVLRPSLKQWRPAKTAQAVSGMSTGLLMAAPLALAAGFYEDSEITIFLGVLLLSTGATAKACIPPLQAKEDELQVGQRTAEPV